MKRLIVLLSVLLLASCAGPQEYQPTPQEFKLRIEGAESVKVSTEESSVSQNKAIPYDELCFYNARVGGDTAYMTLGSAVSDYETTKIWNDFHLIRNRGIKKVIIFFNSPGGSAFDGFGMSDQIQRLVNDGVEVIAEGTGLIASAAVPVFMSASKRVVSPNTIFLVHPATIFKFFSSEGLKDIISQQRLLQMMRDKYARIISGKSKISFEKAKALMEEDSWFDAQQALEWGVVDHIQ